MFLDNITDTYGLYGQVVPNNLDIDCGVCGTKLNYEKTFYGCPHRKTIWHKKVVSFREEANRLVKVKKAEKAEAFLNSAEKLLKENM